MLGCLVCSMIGGAALLSWLQPDSDEYLVARSGLDEAGQERVFHGLARRLLAEANQSGNRWQDIEIVPVPSDGASLGGLLAATPNAVSYDFLVSQVGGYRTGAPQTRSDNTGIVRVALAVSDVDGSIPTVQWLALRVLLLELGSQMGPGEGIPTVRLESPSGDQGDSNRRWRQLRTLLLKDGFLG